MCTNVSQLHQQGLRAPFGPYHVRAPGKYPHLPPKNTDISGKAYFPSLSRVLLYVTFWEVQSNILTQADTNKPLAVREVAIAVKCHTRSAGGSRAKVRRIKIPAPIVTLLVTVTRVTGNLEARVERMITDQHLVRVSVVCSKTVPQSISTCGSPIVRSGRYGLGCSPLKVNLASRLVINKDNFCELYDKNKCALHIFKPAQDTLIRFGDILYRAISAGYLNSTTIRLIINYM